MKRLILIFPIWLMITCTIDHFEQEPITAKDKPPQDTNLDVDIEQAPGPIDMFIISNKTVFDIDDKVVITATVRGEEAEFFIWAIDGIEVVGNGSKLKMRASVLSEGSHRIDCVAVISGRTAGRTGSDTVFIERY